MKSDTYRIAMVLVGALTTVIPILIFLRREAEAVSFAIVIGLVTLMTVSGLKHPRS